MSNASDSESETWTAPEGEEFFFHPSETETGSDGAFYAIYPTSERRQQHGWVCANCDTAETVMGPMAAIECTQCGNERKPRQWDAAYL